jgi:DNA-binding CsgD family transcriptional regulator
MFEAATQLQGGWQDDAALPAADPLKPGGMDIEALALLCPDWREPMLALDVDSRAVCYANHGALELFKRRFPLNISCGRLQLSTAHADERLARAMRSALHRGVARSAIVVDDDEHDLTYSVRICVPQGFMRDVLRRRVHGGDRLVVLELTTGRQALARDNLAALAEAFGLTLAEMSVLALLGQGHSLAEIASARGVEIDTVRGQCKLLLSKTRSRRQSDLVKLVVALCAHDTVSDY